MLDRVDVVDAVDPVYQELLAEFLPVLDLPGRIRESVERSAFFNAPLTAINFHALA